MNLKSLAIFFVRLSAVLVICLEPVASTIQCTQLPSPGNGRLKCAVDSRAAQTRCEVVCNSGYGYAPRKRKFQCSNVISKTVPDTHQYVLVPDCTAIHYSAISTITGHISYLLGHDCTSDVLRDFTKQCEHSFHQNILYNIANSTVASLNVVLCNKTIVNGVVKHKINMTFDVLITTYFPNRTLDQLGPIFTSLADQVLKNSNCSSLNVDLGEAVLGSLWFKPVGIVPGCSEGSVMFVTQGTCVPCPPGFYYRQVLNGSCEPCEKNTFQSEIGRSKCWTCPNGKSTGNLSGQSNSSSCTAGDVPSDVRYTSHMSPAAFAGFAILGVIIVISVIVCVYIDKRRRTSFVVSIDQRKREVLSSDKLYTLSDEESNLTESRTVIASITSQSTTNNNLL